MPLPNHQRKKRLLSLLSVSIFSKGPGSEREMTNAVNYTLGNGTKAKKMGINLKKKKKFESNS